MAAGSTSLRDNLNHASIHSEKDGAADVTFFGGDEEPLTVLGVDEKGKAQLRFLEKKGKLKFSFPP